jgi:hypothetical protein
MMLHVIAARRRAVAAVLGVMLFIPAAGAEDVTSFDALTALVAAQLADGREAIEERLALLHPLLMGAAAPAVADLIAASRDDAIKRGVETIPVAIRREIGDYVPAEVLDAVRWCAACGGELSLQKTTFMLGIAPAITLDYVIVFADRKAAENDPALWIHELKHVMQFEEWGVEGFAARYVGDYGAVEHEAAEFRWQWVQSTGWLERRKLRTELR